MYKQQQTNTGTYKNHSEPNTMCWLTKTLKGHQYGYLMKSLGLGSKNMLFVFRFLCLITFHKHKQQFVYILKKTLKGHQYGYLMKGLGLGSKNMLFIFRFSCLFTFRKHKQQFGGILKKRSKVINMGI